MQVVCHLITKLELGGAQEVAMRVVDGLDRSRFRPVLVAGPGGLLTDEARALKSVDVHLVPSLVRDIRPMHDARALWDLVRLFRRLRPKIVHTHSSKAGILGRLAAWLAGVPCIVHTIHGYGITPAQSSGLRRTLIALERLVGKVTTHWIAVSQADRRQGLDWGLFSTSQVTIVRPGIDPAPFQRRIETDERERIRKALGVEAGHRLVGSIACLKPQKCPEDFVRVAAQVCRHVPEAVCVLVGDGALRPQVDALIASLGMAQRIRLLGWRRDIPALMQAFDVFLLTSQWEGLPCVLLEARAAGVPIVATDVGGAAEAVGDRAQAVLCRPGDIQGMADRVRRVLQDEPPHRAARLSRDEFPEEFTIHETVKQYQALYTYLLHTLHPAQDMLWLSTTRSRGRTEVR